MAYKIVISPYAHFEEYEAYDWYETQRKGLGEELLKELEIAYHRISLHPEYFGFIDERKELRDCLLPRFPFLIVFKIESNSVQIIALHHVKKHPTKKYGSAE